LTPNERATLLVDAMTLEEKIRMIGRWDPAPEGTNWSGGTPGCPRLKVPPVQYNDGPQGFNGNAGT